MILLQGQTLQQKNWFRPESMQLQLGERDSSATITVGPEAPEIAIGDWMRDDTEPGLGVVWRVKSVDTNYRENTRTIGLEHVIQTLKDTVMFGEVDTGTLGGGDAKKAAQYVLSKQSIWTLGDFQYSLSAPFEFNSDDLLSAMEEITSALADCVWEYDLTALPFKLHIRKQNTAVKCEMRGGRNLSTLQKSIDRSRMYTRIYPIGNDNLTLGGGGYIQKNQNIYGVICKVETDQAYSSEEQLRQWATDRLRRHCEPTVTITINGLELSQETGEPLFRSSYLDKLVIGTVCRVPVPELGVVMTEKITRLQWKDKIKDPKDVTVTLANNREDVATIWKNEASTAAKAGRTGAKVAGKQKGLVEDTAKGLYTHINQTAEKIELEAANTKKELRAAIKIEADRIGLLVEGTGENAKIKPASIVASINDAGSSVVISADHISLDGKTTISQLLTGKAHISKLMVNDLQVQAQGGMGYLPVTNCINTAIVSNNELKLYRMSGELVATFSKATSLSGKWGSGTYTVTAKQGTKAVGINRATIRQLYQSGGVSKIGKSVGQTVSVYASENGGSNSVYTGFQQQIWIDASSVWQDGRDSAPSYSSSCRITCDSATPQGGSYTKYTYSCTVSSAQDAPTRTVGDTVTVHW